METKAIDFGRLIRKFFETPRKDRAKRTLAYIKAKVTNHAWPLYMKLLNLILYHEFYIQRRPYYDLVERKCPRIAEFNGLWNRGRPYETDDARLYFLYMIVSTIIEKRLDGAVAEIGVYKGHTAAVLHRLLPDKRLYLFDTFKGFSDSDVRTEKTVMGLFEKVGQFGDTTIEIVNEKLGDTTNVVLCPGLFPETIKNVPEQKTFCLVHFDADLYSPAKAACEYFFPRLVNCGVMVFHDYNNKYAGVKKAVDEYFNNDSSFIIPIPDRFGTAVIVKYPTQV